MKVRIHRGSKQIGGTCVELEQDGRRIALDFGLPLDGDAKDGRLAPQLPSDGWIGIVISHPHLDHYGLLHYAPPAVPIAMGAAARRIVGAAAPFTGQALPVLAGPELEHAKQLALGPFRITPYLIDHSAFDAYALLVEAGGKRLFYSGDFRGHGRKHTLFEGLLARPPAGIDVLLMEGSSLTRLEGDERFPSESDLEDQLAESLARTPGMVMLHASAQNIDRVVSLYRACKKTGRTLLVDLYAAAILEATGNRHIPQSNWPGVALFIPESQRRLIKRNGWFDLLGRHSTNRVFPNALKVLAPKSAILFRPLMMVDLEESGALDGAGFIYSQWGGYLESGSYRAMEGWLTRHGIPMRHIHTSGHASPSDLRRFAAALASKAVVPIHSFAPEKYREIFENVVCHDDGQWWEV